MIGIDIRSVLCISVHECALMPLLVRLAQSNIEICSLILVVRFVIKGCSVFVNLIVDLICVLI